MIPLHTCAELERMLIHSSGVPKVRTNNIFIGFHGTVYAGERWMVGLGLASSMNLILRYLGSIGGDC